MFFLVILGEVKSTRLELALFDLKNPTLTISQNNPCWEGSVDHIIKCQYRRS